MTGQGIKLNLESHSQYACGLPVNHVTLERICYCSAFFFFFWCSTCTVGLGMFFFFPPLQCSRV